MLAAIVKELPYQELSEFTGGTASNAIPTSASILVSVNHADTYTFKARFSSFADELKKEYANTDPDVIVTFEKTESPAYAYSHAAAEQIITSVASCVNGVIEKSDIGVLTSSSIGTITSDEHKITLGILPRASDNSTLKQVEKDITSHFEKHGFTVKEDSLTPAWELSEEDPEFVQTILNNYQTVFGKEPNYKAIHGGLECGIIDQIKPGINTLTVGATIQNPHTINERVNIESINKIEELVFSLIKGFAKITTD